MYGKVVKITTIILLLLLLVAFLIKGFKVILLIVAGILIATFYQGIASFLQTKLPINNTFAVAISLVAVLIIFIGVGYLIYPRVSEQIQILQQQLPKSISTAKEYLTSDPVGSYIVEQVDGMDKNYGKYSKKITSFFSSFFSGLTDLYIIFFLGLFFMFQPGLYKEGLIRLFPKKRRERMNQVMKTVGYTLKRWLLGKLFSMLIVGILTGIGLSIIGIPLALTLGLFAAIITFIPNFGPLLSLLPALLLALTKGPEHALYVIILYVAIQAIESNLITPLIQQKMISFPLAMVLIAQVALGIFTGILGVILAVPIVAIIMVLVKMLYIEDILGDREIEVKGEEKFTD